MIYDKEATVQLLGRLKDGDRPLEQGDTFHHPEHGPVVVSRVYGWQDKFQFHHKAGKGSFDPCRALVLSFLRPGKKKAQKVNILPSAVEMPVAIEGGGQA